MSLCVCVMAAPHGNCFVRMGRLRRDEGDDGLLFDEWTNIGDGVVRCERRQFDAVLAERELNFLGGL